MRYLFAFLLFFSDLAFGASKPVTAGEPWITGQVSVTEGAFRMRRRHENDMDFSKYNPFYWEGRLGTYKIEDFTSKGERKLKVTLTSEWPQNYIPTRGPDFSAVYTGDPVSATEHLRSKFLFNIRMNHVRDFRVFEATLDEGYFNAAGDAMKPGAILTMEFRFFMDESFSGWQQQKAANPHNLSAYYTEFVRVKVGYPGVVIDHPFESNGEASPLRYSGGGTTTPTARVEPWKALQQQAFNMRPNNDQAFLNGRAWFHTDFGSGQHVSEDSDDKPSVFFEGDRSYRAGYAGNSYNQRTCIACHHNNGTSLPVDVGGFSNSVVIRTNKAGTRDAHSSFGKQVQTDGDKWEGSVKITRWETKEEAFADGNKITLRKPIYEVTATNGTNKDNLGMSVRRPQAIIGMGLLEAIPSSQLDQWAKDNGGKRAGRFGWKAEQGSVRDQVISAISTDMSVETEAGGSIDCKNGCKKGKGKLFAPAVDDLTTYVQLLGVAPRLNPENAKIQRGAQHFGVLGCNKCHIPAVRTGDHKFPELAHQDIQPFTDLLLHDMGDGLKDDSGNDKAKLWRTAPLWGLKDVRAANNSRQDEFRPGDVSIVWTRAWEAVKGNPVTLLHDGRASSLEEAILWHGGEAEAAKQAYRKLNKYERDELHSYLWDL